MTGALWTRVAVLRIQKCLHLVSFADADDSVVSRPSSIPPRAVRPIMAAILSSMGVNGVATDGPPPAINGTWNAMLYLK